MLDGTSTYRGVAMRYGYDAAHLHPRLARVFLPLHADASTRAWIDDAIAAPHGPMLLLARKSLGKLMSDYDANGLLGIHDMRVVGTEQLRLLLGGRPGGRLLDVGAGDGHVTAELAPLFDDVVTTELSARMAERLRKRGYPCHEVDLVERELPERAPFDCISLLNVIDRTPRPLSLLERLSGLLAPGGRLVLAVPLPLSPHVHVGPMTVDPEERLPVDRMSWEAGASTLLEAVFEPLGWDVTGLSRVPYLCRGEAGRPVHVLDDAIFVMRSKRRSEPAILHP
jgi:SAM-dependent methyltransferase